MYLSIILLKVYLYYNWQVCDYVKINYNQHTSYKQMITKLNILNNLLDKKWTYMLLGFTFLNAFVTISIYLVLRFKNIQLIKTFFTLNFNIYCKVFNKKHITNVFYLF